MNSLAKRMLGYLKNHTSESPEKWVVKSELQDLAIEAGYTSMMIKDAFKALDEMITVGNVWNAKTRQVEYMFYRMTPAEIAKKQADRDWFDSL